jgi:hypothetical protein
MVARCDGVICEVQLRSPSDSHPVARYRKADFPRPIGGCPVKTDHHSISTINRNLPGRLKRSPAPQQRRATAQAANTRYKNEDRYEAVGSPNLSTAAHYCTQARNSNLKEASACGGAKYCWSARHSHHHTPASSSASTTVPRDSAWTAARKVSRRHLRRKNFDRWNKNASWIDRWTCLIHSHGACDLTEIAQSTPSEPRDCPSVSSLHVRRDGIIRWLIQK